tara:strand:+ start:1307 stop:1543 length:237 start_codon:yes stop_codon:yes gene_type:complete
LAHAGDRLLHLPEQWRRAARRAITRRMMKQETPMARIILTFAALAALTACATVEGVGKDLETAGKTISSEAREAQAGM